MYLIDGGRGRGRGPRTMLRGIPSYIYTLKTIVELVLISSPVSLHLLVRQTPPNKSSSTIEATTKTNIISLPADFKTITLLRVETYKPRPWYRRLSLDGRTNLQAAIA